MKLLAGAASDSALSSRWQLSNASTLFLGGAHYDVNPQLDPATDKACCMSTCVAGDETSWWLSRDHLAAQPGKHSIPPIVMEHVVCMPRTCGGNTNSGSFLRAWSAAMAKRGGEGARRLKRCFTPSGIFAGRRVSVLIVTHVLRSRNRAVA